MKKSATFREIVRVLGALGFSLDRIEGSHHQYFKPGHRWIVTVQFHGNKPLPPKTFRSVLRQMEVSREAFFRHLSEL